MKLWSLIALGVGSYLLFALWTLPATIVLSRLAASGVHADGVTGTVWNGSAEVLQIGQTSVGKLQWQLRPLPLFAGRASADVTLVRSDGSARGRITVRRGAIDFEKLNAALPISSLPMTMVPGGWIGEVNLKLDSLSLENGWPTRATGTVQVIDVTGPPNRPINMGSFQVTLPAPGAKPEAGALAGAITDLGGPLQVNGTLQLKPDRTYVVEGSVATRPEAPADVAKGLQYLGAPDANGQRPFSIAGSL
jgi:general secretion pathway protein N